MELNYDYGILVPKEVYEINGNIALAYALLQPMCNSCNFMDSLYVDSRMLKFIYGEVPKKIIEEMNILSELFGNNLGQNRWEINKDKFLEHGNQFVIIKYKYLSLLMNENPALFQYLCYVVKSCGPQKVGNKSVKAFADLLNVSSKTIMNYNKKLEELNILYIRHSTCMFTNTENGGKYKPSNAYGLIENKSIVDQFANENLGKDSSYSSNQKKSLMQKYNRLVNGKKYSHAEIIEIKKFITAHNEHELRMFNDNPSYIPNIKETGIFKALI